MNLHKCILTENDCYKRNVKIAPKGIMVHSTGCNNPWLCRYVQPNDGLLGNNRYSNDWNQPGLNVCVHGFIGKLDDGTIATYQTLPFDVRSWHCARSGNDTHISFEICEDNTTNRDYFEATYNEAVEFAAYLCKLYNFDPLKKGVIVSHAEGYDMGIASDHSDVGHWWNNFGVTMDDFRKDVDNLMKGMIELTINKDELMQLIKTTVKETVDENNKSRNFANLENVPKWAKATVQKLLDGEVLKGDGEALNLSYDCLRILVILDRLGKL